MRNRGRLRPDPGNYPNTQAVGYYRNGTGIIDRVQQLLAPVHNIGRDGDRPDPPDRKVADQVLGRAVKVEADPVTFFHPEVQETQSYTVHLVPEFSIAVSLVAGGADERCLGFGDAL